MNGSWISSARAGSPTPAWNGFLKARKYGTYKIHEILQTGTMERETSVLRR